MKKTLTRALAPLMLLVLSAWTATAQQSLSFSLHMPEQPLSVHAGTHHVYDGTTPITLGASPAATGAFGAYTYAWEPAEYLDDPAAPNPLITYLDGPTTFTLTVSDPGALCSKQAQVHVDYMPEVPQLRPEAQAYPNPFDTRLHFESTAPMEEIIVTDMTGQLIASHRNLQVSAYQLESGLLPAGVYFFMIRFADGSTTVKKLCKIH